MKESTKPCHHLTEYLASLLLFFKNGYFVLFLITSGGGAGRMGERREGRREGKERGGREGGREGRDGTGLTVFSLAGIFLATAGALVSIINEIVHPYFPVSCHPLELWWFRLMDVCTHAGQGRTDWVSGCGGGSLHHLIHATDRQDLGLDKEFLVSTWSPQYTGDFCDYFHF